MKTYWESGGIAHAFLTSAIDGGEWSASRLGRFITREKALGAYNYDFLKRYVVR
jgi:hypothetical protein